jgi:dCMP deaminase
MATIDGTMNTIDGKWQARFMGLAKAVSTWSKDSSSQVGAVIVRPDRTICSIGFNGFPRGVEDGSDRIANRDTKLLFTIHAEMNAILSAKEPLKDYSIFVWPFQPCAHCAASIIQSGIKEVYCPFNAHLESYERWANSFKAALQMFDEAGVKVIFS